MEKLAVTLDPESRRRLLWAARRAGQRPDAYLKDAAEEAVRQALIEEARARWRQDTLSLPELAAETGVPVEELAALLGPALREASLATFLQAGREIAAARDDPAFATLLEQAVAEQRARHP